MFTKRKVMFYRSVLLLSLVMVCNDAFAQHVYIDTTAKGKPFRHKKNRNFFWFTPSNTDHINGIAFGMYSMPQKQKKQTINGLNIEVPVMWPLYGLAMGFGTIFMPVHKYRKNKLNDTDQVHPHQTREIELNFFAKNDEEANEFINGLDISLGAGGKRRSRGLNINVITSMYLENDGVSLSLLSNWVYHFHGVLIAPVGNVSRSGGGVQIGLFNSCINCSGLQIGLINQNGKRTVPFISYRSKKRARKLEQETLE